MLQRHCGDGGATAVLVRHHGGHGGGTAVYAVQAPQWHRVSGVTGVLPSSPPIAEVAGAIPGYPDCRPTSRVGE